MEYGGCINRHIRFRGGEHLLGILTGLRVPIALPPSLPKPARAGWSGCWKLLDGGREALEAPS
jgi:hypothetical protein